MSGNNYAHVHFSIKIEKKIQTKEKLHMNYYVGRRGEFFKKKSLTRCYLTRHHDDKRHGDFH